jgi:trimeric autotransporter adhesin
VASVLLWLFVGVCVFEGVSPQHFEPLPAAHHRLAPHNGLSTLPLAARGLVSAALGAHSSGYDVGASTRGLEARSSAEGLRMRFGLSGVQVRSGDIQVGLGLRAAGYGDSLEGFRPVVPTAQANRVIYRRAGISEWYANGPLGLEQGFTLARRPRGPRAGPLTLSVGRLSGAMSARVTSDRRSVVLYVGEREVLRYAGLFVSDRSGRSLPARTEVSGGSLLLRIDDRGARYPLRVDPFVQAAKLSASHGGLGDQLGVSVGISGDGSTIVAGAPQATGGLEHESFNQGAVYVFVMSGTGWANATETGTLSAADGGAYDYLGSSVAVSSDGSTIVAGAPHSDPSHPGSGAAYVFVRPPTGWAEQSSTAKLTASSGGADWSGSSIAVSGDGSTVAVGSPLATVAGREGQGAAYVFERPGGGWGSDTQPQHQTAKLTASDGAANDGLGGDNGGSAIAVSSDGSTVAAGAATATASGCPGECLFGPGAVYVFVKPVSGWGSGEQPQHETARLTASDGHGGGPGGGDRFGDAVAISSDGSTIVAGALLAAVNSNSQQGSVYVFVKPGGGWTGQHETAKLTAQDGHGQDKLGRSVAVSSDGSTVVAGAYFATVGANAAQGKIYVFARPAGGWTTGTAQGELTAADGAPSDELGFAVAVSSDGSTLVGGARFASLAHALEGATYVFAPPGSIPLGPPVSLPAYGKSGPSGGGSAPGSGSPAASGESISPSSFEAAPSGPSAASARRRKYGARVTYTLNMATEVRFTVQQRQPGRYTGNGRKRRCVAQTRKNAKAKKCTRLVTLRGSFALSGLAGANSFRFTGRLGGKTLKPGTYALVATPMANGKAGHAATATFRIKR